MSTQQKTKQIFATEDEEREFWATHSPLDYFNRSAAKQATFPNLRPTLKSISIRLPTNMLEDLKVLANKRDVPYQSLAKLYLAWGIDAERKNIGTEPMPGNTAKRIARPQRADKRSP